MKQYGKILFFNSSDGNGIIISSSKEKFDFNVSQWNDYEVMPALGLEIEFENVNNDVKDISVLQGNQDLDQNEKQESLNDPSEKEVLHFQEDEEIEVLTNVEEEYGKKEESVTLTLNLKIALDNYFHIISEHLLKRETYVKINGRLNYLLIRRFLWTMFNNLSEIDVHIITPQIRSLSEDLKVMTRLHDDFMKKIKYPYLAYEEVFLSCQNEYMKIKKGAQDMMERLSRLKNSEQHVGSILKVKKDELSQNIQSQEFDLLQDELKSLNGAYVDIVHMMAELDERYKHDIQLLQTFEMQYREDFYEMFNKAAQSYKIKLVDILNAQAYLLDTQLWEKAKSSKAVKSHFQQASIEGEFNTKTYLKYYLESLDSKKTRECDKKLLELYNYLVSINKEHIMIVTSSVEDAIDFEAGLKSLGSSYEVKAFVDEKLALKWAMKHSIKVLILEDYLSRFSAEVFLKYYQKYILVNPKIVLLGNKPSHCPYPLSKLLSKNISPKIVGEYIKDLLEAKK